MNGRPRRNILPQHDIIVSYLDMIVSMPISDVKRRSPPLRALRVIAAALCLGMVHSPAWGQAAATLKGHSNTVTCLAFVPGGKTLVTGAARGQGFAIGRERQAADFFLRRLQRLDGFAVQCFGSLRRPICDGAVDQPLQHDRFDFAHGNVSFLIGSG